MFYRTSSHEPVTYGVEIGEGLWKVLRVSEVGAHRHLVLMRHLETLPVGIIRKLPECINMVNKLETV